MAQRRIFEELSYSAPVSQFAGAVDFTRGLGKLDKKYEEVDAAEDYGLDTLNADKDVKTAYLKDINGSLDEIATKDPFEATRQIKKRASRDKILRGDRNTAVGATQYNKELAKQFQEENNKVETDDNIKRLKEAIAFHNYEKQGGIGEYGDDYNPKDPVKGFNTFSGARANKKVDEDTIVSTLGTGWASDQSAYANVGVDASGRFIASNKGTTEVVDGRQVEDYVYKNLTGNTEWLGGARDKAQLDIYNESLNKYRNDGLSDDEARQKALDDAQDDGQINTRVDARAKELARGEGIKRGFYKQEKDADMKTISETNEEQHFNKAIEMQRFEMGVENNPAFSQFEELSADSIKPTSFNAGEMSDSDLKSLGINRTIVDIPNTDGGSSKAPVYKDASGKTLTAGDLEKRLQDHYKDKPLSRIETLTKNNPILKEVFDDIVANNPAGLKGLAMPQQKLMAETAIARYNSKLKGMKTNKIVAKGASKEMKESFNSIYLGDNEGAVGAIAGQNIMVDGKPVPFTTFLQSVDPDMQGIMDNKTLGDLSPEEVKNIKSKIEIVGFDANGGAGEMVITYKGKPYRMTGSQEQNMQRQPLQKVYQGLYSNQKKSAEEIDFSSMINAESAMPLKGKVKYEDIWDGNNFAGRTAVVTITQSGIPGVEIGETITLEELHELQKQGDITSNIGAKGVTRDGKLDAKLGKGVPGN